MPRLISILTILLLGVLSCKKHSTSSSLDFTYSGTPNVGYLVTFQCTTGAGSYLWTFGDGSKSTDPKPNHSYAYASSFVVTLVVNNDSAKKITKTIVIGPAFDFTFSGVPAAGNALSFTSTAPAGSALLWSFGDGGASTDATPTHTFSSNSSFAVSLLLNGDSAHIITKTINIFADAIYLSLIPGTKTWHHVYTDAYPWPPYHTPHIMADTPMTITFIAPGVVAIGADTLAYSNSIQSDSVLVFGHNTVYYSDINTYLHFNHFTSDISYTRDIHISAGAGDATDAYTTP